MADIKIAKEVKIQILQNDMQVYVNTKWQMEQRYAVAKALNKPAEILDEIEKQVLECQMYITKYMELIAAVEAE